MEDLRLLILEDNEDDALLVAETLRGEGVDLEWERVEDAAALSERLPAGWDTVFCDYSMPTMSADEALRIVREFDPDLPFILVSGTIDPLAAVDLMRKGASDYVYKDHLERLAPALIREVRDAQHRRNERVARVELQEIQRRFRDTVEQSAVGIAHADRNGRYLWVNQRFCEIVGRRQQELIGVSFEKITHPDDLEIDLEAKERTLAGEITEFTNDKRYLKPDGSPVWVSLTVTRIDDDEGDFAYFTTVTLDITDRKQAEAELARTTERLREAEQEYRAIVETMGEGLYTLDRENHLLYANPEFCRMVGYELDELLGENVVDRLAFPEDRETVQTYSSRRLRGFSDKYESRMKRRNGEEIAISMNAVPRFDAKGTVIGKLCVVSDITDEKRQATERDKLRKQVEELNRIESLGKLAGKMAHEFNNVLMGIQPFTEVIEKLADDDRVVNGAQKIKEAVRRGRRVTQEVLRFSRPAEPDRKEIATTNLVREVAENAKSLAGSNHSIAFECHDPEAHVAIDPEQIHQVFTNLVINARDAMDHGGTIAIEARRDPPGTTFDFGVINDPETYVHFMVRDEGCGIPESMVQKIFEPMITTKRNGTGLGLAITHQIIHAHGGAVFAESTEGEGTTMHLFLPIASR